MKKIYQQISTGNLYVIAGGDLELYVGTDGEPLFTLAPVHLMFGKESGLPVDVPRQDLGYVSHGSNFPLNLIVCESQFESEFVFVEHLVARQNTPLAQLIAEYEADDCNFADKAWLYASAMKYADTMQDCLVRCLLHSLAKAMGEPSGAVAHQKSK